MEEQNNPACPYPTSLLEKLEIAESPLKQPVNHSLVEIFKELRFGRTAPDQQHHR